MNKVYLPIFRIGTSKNNKLCLITSLLYRGPKQCAENTKGKVRIPSLSCLVINFNFHKGFKNPDVFFVLFIVISEHVQLLRFRQYVFA